MVEGPLSGHRGYAEYQQHEAHVRGSILVIIDYLEQLQLDPGEGGAGND